MKHLAVQHAALSPPASQQRQGGSGSEEELVKGLSDGPRRDTERPGDRRVEARARVT